jgi:hypothetical protein
MAGTDLPSPHTRTFPCSRPRGECDGGASGAQRAGRVLHTTPFLPWSNRARLDRGDGDLPCATAGASGALRAGMALRAGSERVGASGAQRAGSETAGARQPGRRERGRERERATVGRTVHQNRCVRLHYRLIE